MFKAISVIFLGALLFYTIIYDHQNVHSDEVKPQDVPRSHSYLIISSGDVDPNETQQILNQIRTDIYNTLSDATGQNYSQLNNKTIEQTNQETSQPEEESIHDIIRRLDKEQEWHLDDFDGYVDWDEYYNDDLLWGYD